jgi:hypothetical protein
MDIPPFVLTMAYIPSLPEEPTSKPSAQMCPTHFPIGLNAHRTDLAMKLGKASGAFPQKLFTAIEGRLHACDKPQLQRKRRLWSRATGAERRGSGEVKTYYGLLDKREKPHLRITWRGKAASYRRRNTNTQELPQMPTKRRRRGISKAIILVGIP